MNRLSLLILFLLMAGALRGQSIKAVLVQLNSEQNRVHYFMKSGHNADAAEIEEEAKKARAATVLDFKGNFDYCPVYYFMDTNRDEVKNKHFANMLMNADGSAVVNPSITPADSDYVIVYFGYGEDNKSVAYDQKSLIVLNDKFIQIAVIFRSQIGQSATGNEPGAIYTYISPKYDIYYSAHAEKLNDHMDKVMPKLHRSRD